MARLTNHSESTEATGTSQEVLWQVCLSEVITSKAQQLNVRWTNWSMCVVNEDWWGTRQTYLSNGVQSKATAGCLVSHPRSPCVGGSNLWPAGPEYLTDSSVKQKFWRIGLSCLGKVGSWLPSVLLIYSLDSMLSSVRGDLLFYF